MKYTIVNIQELLAALKPSEFRPFKDAILKKEYKKYLNHIFKDHDRLYIPFETFEIEVPTSIETFLNDNNYSVEDYKEGLAKNKNGRLIKIGKLLKDHERLLKTFNESRSSVKQELAIVISRHPYDLAGMASGRHWENTSCMGLTKGNSEYIYRDIENGTLVAYVIRKNDLNIKHPISRILIKQFIDLENMDNKILYPEKTMYGEKIKGFRETLIEWLNTFQKISNSTYRINPELYPDGLPYLGNGNKYSKNSESRLIYYKNNPDDVDAKKDEEYKIRLIYYKENFNDKDAKNDENDLIRQYYYKNNTDNAAKYDKYDSIRELYYNKNPRDKDAKKDESSKIRLIYYNNNEEDPDAKNDPDTTIQRIYYETYTKDKDAKKSNDDLIRMTYYRNNPWDIDAKEDKVHLIREIYYKYNIDDEDAKKDKIFAIRELYYTNNPKDKDAKFDEEEEFRYNYYYYYPKDLDCKKDKSSIIRKLYYSRHPEDKDALKDIDEKIRNSYLNRI